MKKYGKNIQTKNGKAKAEEYFLKFTTTGRKINGKNIKLTDIQILNAVCKYKNECKKNKVEQQYIKHGDTFFNKAIIDYIEESKTDNTTEQKNKYKEIKLTGEQYEKMMNERGKKYE